MIFKSKGMLNETLNKSHKYNYFLSGIIIFILLGYMFFLTSKYWFSGNEDLITPSRLNSTKTWNEREVTLLGWKYDEAQQLMEVQINVKNLSADGINNYIFSAMDIEKGFFDTQTILNENGLLVVWITDISPKWSQLSLRMQLDLSENTDVLKMYTNKEDVERVNNIQKLSYEDYMIEKLQNLIGMYKAEITALENKIEEQNQAKVNYQANITQLQAQEAYQTQEEINETQQTINRIQSEIGTCEETISNAQNNIEEYKKRISNAEQQTKNYKK